MNHNYKDHRGVVHDMNDVTIHVTAYNATSWRAWCGVGLLGASLTREGVDCMTCLVRGTKR